MLSKEDKLKYGEQLRRQMKQKEQKKKVDDMQKRGGLRKSPTDTRIPIEPEQYIDNKQSLQNRFEGQNIDYFGRPGGGAPNRVQNDHNQTINHPQYNNFQYNQQGRMKTSQEYVPYPNQPIGNPNYNYPPQLPPPRPQLQAYSRGPMGDMMMGKGSMPAYQQFQNPADFVRQQQQAYNNGFSTGPYAPPSYSNPQQGLQNRVPTDRSFVENPGYDPRQYPPPGYGNYPQQRHQPIQPVQLYQQPIQQINQKHEAYRQKTLQNEQLMQIHKKGGRNLLKLENMTIDQQQIKQKQKQEMRKQLQLQMKQAQDRKKEQQERIKRQQIEEQRKNIQYLELQKRRLDEEQRKKNDKQRQLQEQNARNLEERRRLQEQAKQKALRQKMKRSNGPAETVPNSPKFKQKQVFSRQAQFQAQVDETTSEVSSSTVMDKAFNTGVSKQFFENERRKDQQRYNRQKNLQAVTDEIKRLKQHIDKQNDFFKKQIMKVKLESEMAESQKKKAQLQIENLKKQLKQKMEDDNQRLFMALQRQETLTRQDDNYRAPQRNNERKSGQYNQNVESLRPARDEKLVKKQYAVPESPKKTNYNMKLGESNVSEDGMLVSLHGDSKKIPLNLPEDKLSMSQLSDFARQTKFFKNEGKSPYLGNKKSFQAHESIAQQDEDRSESRAAPRKQSTQKIGQQKDELDKLVESRQKSRGGNGNNWGQLSSVNSDITKQIEQLLKQKSNQHRPPSSTKYDNPYNKLLAPTDYQERPSSHLSNAGKRTLSRNGIQYEGASLGTISDGVGTLGTVEVENILHKNEKRSANLRNLGVQTINTNEDHEFSQLDRLLKNFQQSRVVR